LEYTETELTLWFNKLNENKGCPIVVLLLVWEEVVGNSLELNCLVSLTSDSRCVVLQFPNVLTVSRVLTLTGHPDCVQLKSRIFEN